MIKTIRKILCDHKERYAYRKYNEFDFTEYWVCRNCNEILETLKGFDEDLRG